MMKRNTLVALISEHASPAALLGGADAGGQNVYVDELSRHLAALGYRIDVYTRRDSARAPEELEWAPGVRIRNIPAGPATAIPKDDLWALMPEFRDGILRRMLGDGARPDVLHGNFWMSGWVAAELKEALGIPAVQIFHATGKTKRRHQAAADTSPWDRIAVELDVVRGVDRVIAQCPAERAELVDEYRADPARIALIPSAVNLHRFRPVERGEARRRIGLDTGGPAVVYVGRMMPRKDVRNAVRAVALLNRERPPGAEPVRLLVVGGEGPAPDPLVTPEIGELQRLAAELGIPELVTFTGQRQPDELHLYYSAGDVAVTTPWYEPFGFTPLEAMACGRPVVGSAVGGLTHTIEDGVTGYLVPPRDPAALAARLGTLFGSERLRREMGRAGRERVERRFTWERVAARTAALYDSLLGPARSGRRWTPPSVPAPAGPSLLQTGKRGYPGE